VLKRFETKRRSTQLQTQARVITSMRLVTALLLIITWIGKF